MLDAECSNSVAQPYVTLTSRIQTQNRAGHWAHKQALTESADTLKVNLAATALRRIDGIAHQTAKEANTDVEKAQRRCDWIVTNTYRESKVRGCGDGDIKAMLETGNLGGICAGLNALFSG